MLEVPDSNYRGPLEIDWAIFRWFIAGQDDNGDNIAGYALADSGTVTVQWDDMTEFEGGEDCNPGACCEVDGSCNIKPQCECDTENGAVFAGVGETCEVCAPADCCGEGGRAGQPLALLYDNGTVSVGGTYSGVIVSGFAGLWNVFAGWSGDVLTLKHENYTFGLPGTADLNFRGLGNCRRAGATLNVPFETAGGRRYVRVDINPPTDAGVVGFPSIFISPDGQNLAVTAARFAGITLSPTLTLPQARFFIDYHDDQTLGSQFSVTASVPSADWSGGVEFDWNASGETGTVTVTWDDLISADVCPNPLP